MENLSGFAGSVLAGADHLATADRTQGAPGVPVDRTLDESDRTVAEEDVDSAGVVAPGGQRRKRRAPPDDERGLIVELSRAARVRDRLVGRPGGGHRGLVRVAVGPEGVPPTGGAARVHGGDG